MHSSSETTAQRPALERLAANLTNSTDTSMSNAQLSRANPSADFAITNQILCAKLSLLLTLLLTTLTKTISQTGGTQLANQFEQQLNRYAAQHGWNALTGLTDLAELRQRVPDVEAKILLAVYLSYSRHARSLAQQILGERVLTSALTKLLNSLSPELSQLNTQYEIIRLS